MVNNQKYIDRYRDDLRELLAEEEYQNGGYRKWYENLKDFRNSISKFVDSYFGITYRPHTCILNNGNLLDHHIISYFAPIEMWGGIGWDKNRLTPAEQLHILAEYFIKRGKRFIYVPLPNKAVIYPEYISGCEYEVTWNSPQWRKVLKTLLEIDNGIEIIDAFTILRDKKNKGNVFSKGHHISSFGANAIAKELSDYLNNSTSGFEPYLKLNVKEEDWLYYDWDYISKEHSYAEKLLLHYREDSSSPYYSDCPGSSIGIIGDCNLQHYQLHGAGIDASLSYYSGLEIDNIGRYLPFDSVCPLDKYAISRMLTKDIIIYIAFISASFVRSRLFSKRRFGLPRTWSVTKLD